MNPTKIALISLLVLSCVGLVLSWVTGLEITRWPETLRWGLSGAIIIAMCVLGWHERRREKAADTWVDDPRRSALSNWIERRRQRFNPARGLWFFTAGLIVFTITAGVGALFGNVGSVGGAIAFVLGASVVAGVIGMFTENVPL